jgi:hypothetical protein
MGPIPKMKNTEPSSPDPTAPASLADAGDALAANLKFNDALKNFLHHVEAGHDLSLIAELAISTRVMVEALDAAAVAHPESLTCAACDMVVWPVLVARHQPRGRDFTALADRIGLGSNVVVSVSPRARYRTDTPLNRFLLQVLLDSYIDTPKRFFLLRWPKDRPKLTHRSLPWYLDEYLMPLLNRLREEQGSWDGVPALADLVADVPGATKQRGVIREQIRLALLELAGPNGVAA